MGLLRGSNGIPRSLSLVTGSWLLEVVRENRVEEGSKREFAGVRRVKVGLIRRLATITPPLLMLGPQLTNLGAFLRLFLADMSAL